MVESRMQDHFHPLFIKKETSVTWFISCEQDEKTAMVIVSFIPGNDDTNGSALGDDKAFDAFTCFFTLHTAPFETAGAHTSAASLDATCPFFL